MKALVKISRQELKRWLAEARDFVLIDVATHECFDEEHLPGARCACVFEVTFLEQVKAITEDKRKPIVLYGSSANSKASSEAARKLTEAGSRNLCEFKGGLAEWKNAGWPVEGKGIVTASPSLIDKTYRVDPALSGIEWVGRNLASKHTGTLTLSSGEIIVRNGLVREGSFTIDMRSIANTDIPDRSYAQVLVGHLMSDDFFDVATFPSATFLIRRVVPFRAATPGRPNCQLEGALTLKGVTRKLKFPALVGAAAEGDFVGQAYFDFDRTLWNVLYGSGRFFEKLGKHLVNDLVSIQLKIVAK